MNCFKNTDKNLLRTDKKPMTLNKQMMFEIEKKQKIIFFYVLSKKTKIIFFYVLSINGMHKRSRTMSTAWFGLCVCVGTGSMCFLAWVTVGRTVWCIRCCPGPSMASAAPMRFRSPASRQPPLWADAGTLRGFQCCAHHRRISRNGLSGHSDVGIVPWTLSMAL